MGKKGLSEYKKWLLNEEFVIEDGMADLLEDRLNDLAGQKRFLKTIGEYLLTEFENE